MSERMNGKVEELGDKSRGRKRRAEMLRCPDAGLRITYGDRRGQNFLPAVIADNPRFFITNSIPALSSYETLDFLLVVYGSQSSWSPCSLLELLLVHAAGQLEPRHEPR